MTAIEPLLRQPAAQAVGWALLQFVWQGTAVGALTALALLALRRGASDVRYVVAAIGLALMLTLPVVSGVQKFQALRAEVDTSASPPVRAQARPDDAVQPQRAATRGDTPDQATASLTLRVPAVRVEPLLPTLILLWIAGVSMLSLRLLTGWIWVQRLRTHGTAQAADQWLRMAARLSRRLHISRAIVLLESTLVEVPTVIGWLRPVVLLPASAVAALSPQQLEAILAHELAHVRRHDYLVNLLQTLVETLLFYHPAVWWLSRRIRIERENCCDDLAVRLCGDPVAYAIALTDLESLRSATAPAHHIAMAATGGALLQRVRRLLGVPSSHSGRAPAWLAGSIALILIGGIVLRADGRRAEQREPAAAQGAAAAAARAPVVASTAPALQKAAKPAAPAVASVASVGSVGPVAPVGSVAAVASVASVAAAPAAPSVQASASQSVSHHVSDSTGNWIWSNNGERLQVNYSGTFDFTDDDADIRELSPAGYLKISDGAWFGRHSVEIRERGGQLERRYYVNGSERPYEPEGRTWLRSNLPRFVRNSGIGAPARVARLLKSGAVPAVMAEISHIDGTYVKGIYFKELFKQATLSPDQYRQAMTQASREMKSDYELASLLIAIADRLPTDDASRDVYFTAASSISSDYEVRRVYSTMLKRGPVGAQTLAGILTHAGTIRSNYELSELLRQIVALQPLDDRNRAAFFRAAATIGSDFERHRVLKAAIDRSPDAATIEAALMQAGRMGSDYESATFLHEVLRQGGVEGSVRAPFFKVVSGLGSGHEKGRVLQAVVQRTDVSNDTLREVLKSTRGMTGYELSQVLLAVAGTRTLTGELRDAYLDAADRLGAYEQGQVFAALVKSERHR